MCLSLIRLVCALLVVVVPGISFGGQASSGDHDDLMRLLRRVAPSAGAVEAVFSRNDGAAFAEIAVGYDASTGAWYDASPRGFAGRTADGRAYRGATGQSGFEVSSAPNAGLPIGVAGYFPDVWLRYLLDHPENIGSVRRAQHDLFVVRLEPAPDSVAVPVSIEISSEGRVIRTWSHRETGPDEYLYEYREASGPLAVTAHKPRRPEIRCATVEYHKGDARQQFSPGRVAELAERSRENAARALQAMSQGFEQTSDGKWQRSEAAARLQSGASERYRLPLLATAGAMLLVGLAVLWRRRQAA